MNKSQNQHIVPLRIVNVNLYLVFFHSDDLEMLETLTEVHIKDCVTPLQLLQFRVKKLIV